MINAINESAYFYCLEHSGAGNATSVRVTSRTLADICSNQLEEWFKLAVSLWAISTARRAELFAIVRTSASTKESSSEEFHGSKPCQKLAYVLINTTHRGATVGLAAHGCPQGKTNRWSSPAMQCYHSVYVYMICEATIIVLSQLFELCISHHYYKIFNISTQALERFTGGVLLCACGARIPNDWFLHLSLFPCLLATWRYLPSSLIKCCPNR